ncbi:hypothetical protein VTI74DRAFT_6837 [Chaetomium olivicolor]
MASIGNVTAAAAAARAETTFALANFNFEISLFTKRVSPPIEYEGVGQHLAKSRLEEAQNGRQHTIARTLGLLFKGILPPTPDLIKAYGTRSSEIARSAKANPRGDAASYGPFVNRIGADGTTLWAASTSGHSAIQCHLLACMLARIWDAPEATSLWDEIIVRRKMEVAAKLEAEGEIDTDLMLAAGGQFSRSDLADWDASCRSWLRVADSEKSVQQTRLRLIVDNVDLPVNNKPNTYESVLSAWITAMEEMEKLLGGIHRPVQGGAVLLGLMAWHLYPDLQCLKASNPRVELRDHLFSKRGILTIGLEPAPGKAARSVYWSLSLAHLRYYGLPVTKFSSTRTSERDRITVDELLFAWFCAYIKTWDSDFSIPSGVVTRYAGDIALRLHNALTKIHTTSSAAQEPSKSMSNPSQSWLLLLSQIANKWATSLDQPSAQALRNLGRNFCGLVDAPFQNIFTINTYLEAAMEIEDKICLLREIATSLSTQEVASDYNFELGTAKPLYTLSTKKLMNLFQPDRINFDLLATRHLALDFKTNASLLGMTFIDALYKQLGDATVDVRAAKVNLNKAHWVKSAFEHYKTSHSRQGQDRKEAGSRHFVSDEIVVYLAPSGADMATTFACIAMLETGSFNFHPSELSPVFALCSADSMYVASVLLRDPAQRGDQEVGITRVTGNIGRAGMALMIPPPNPAVRNYEVDEWYLYQHQAFDGVLDDSFGGTSLQLSFTEWKQEVNVGTTGGKDVEAYFLETLISVYDKDKWTADLDVLSTFRSERLLTTFLSLQTCACSTAYGAQTSAAIVAHSGPGIVTARGNWQARLAAAAICIARGYRVILTPDGYCWSCLSRASINGESVSSIIKTSRNMLVMIL